MSEVFVLALLLCNFGSTLARYWLALDIRIEGILARRTREMYPFLLRRIIGTCVSFPNFVYIKEIICQFKCHCPSVLYTQQNTIKLKIRMLTNAG